jgi:hypothetical protein
LRQPAHATGGDLTGDVKQDHRGSLDDSAEDEQAIVSEVVLFHSLEASHYSAQAMVLSLRGAFPSASLRANFATKQSLFCGVEIASLRSQ